MNASSRFRYAIVGTGSRALMYLRAITGTHAEHAELVAWTDTNPGRLDFYTNYVPGCDPGTVARFAPDQLGEVIRELGVDRTIITSPDATHAAYIVTAVGSGSDVIVEKPLATDLDGVKAIIEAVGRTERTVTVTFNYRYAPRNVALRQVIADGMIGEVTSVHFEWLLDTSHGADYFRRWHRDKSQSGGLLVHKASHHFDLVNWWLADTPARVYARGGLRFYGADNAVKRGLGPRPPRGSIDSPSTDAFSLDLRNDPLLKGLYLDQEHHDGYLRDRDVFDDGITIEDNLSLVVDYASGASMSYSLCAHSPWEGYNVAVNGTAGRAELSVVERGAVLLTGDGDRTVDPTATPDRIDADASRPIGDRLVVQRLFERALNIPIKRASGGHGGGDAAMLNDLFRGVGDDPLRRASSWRDGVRAVAVGIAANASLVTREPVAVTELGLDRPTAAMFQPATDQSGSQ